MNDELDRVAARAAKAVRGLADSTADPDGDLAAVYAGVDRPAPASGRSAHWFRWAAAAAAVIAIAGAAVIAWPDENEDPRLVPATAPSVTTPLPTTIPGPTPDLSTPTPDPTTPPTDAAGAPVRTERTSPEAVLGSCEGPSCPDLQYSAAGLPVVYDFAAKEMTVLESTPRTITLDIPETQGRLLAVGPDDVAYLLVELTEEPFPARIVAVPARGANAGAVYDVSETTPGLASVSVVPEVTGIAVTDCCGVGVPDTRYPYLDSNGAPLGSDPSRTAWSWTWREGRIVVRDNRAGRDHEVPADVPDREGPRRGDLRPLVDGRIAVSVSDDAGRQTVWVLDPSSDAWTPTELGEDLVHSVDPAGVVVTRDRSTLAYGFVPLD